MKAAGIRPLLQGMGRGSMNMNGVLKNGIVAPVPAAVSIGGGVTGLADVFVNGGIDRGE
jgi:hypothetical protein